MRPVPHGKVHMIALEAVRVGAGSEGIDGIRNVPKVAGRTWVSLRYAIRKARRRSWDCDDPPCRTDCGTAASWCETRPRPKFGAISLAFIAPGLVKAAIDGRLPRGIGVAALRDMPAEWSLQFERLGLGQN